MTPSLSPISQKELKQYRYLFPVTKKWIYMNHAGVAPISLRVADAVMRYNQEALGEGYTAGPRWVSQFAKIRASCAQLIHAKASEIAFIRNTSHGISLIARGLNLQAGDEVIVSEVEFPANMYPWMALEAKGIVLKKIPCVEGALQLEALPQLITKRTKVLSLSSVQYGTGYRLPVAQVGKICREHGVYFFLDAIQSLGAFPLDVVKEHVDFMAADAHKWLLGHEGIGFLYVREALIESIEPALIGWNSVEGALNFDQIDYRLRKSAGRFEEGSHNGLSLYGLGAAVELALEVGVARIGERLLKLTDQLIAGLQELNLPIANPMERKYRSGIVLFTLPGDSQGHALSELEKHLFSKKIYASIRKGRLRLSPHYYNTEEEISKIIKEIKLFMG